MKIFITGCAGFIGYHVAKRLIESGHVVYGIDNLNDYYDINLKLARLDELGISNDTFTLGNFVDSIKYSNFWFGKFDIEDFDSINSIFVKDTFDCVLNLAAQAGVRYSLENPRAYINTNITGFFNLLDICKNFGVPKVLYASSSSVYGVTESEIFKEIDQTDTPASIYAATKKSNELMAHVYSHLYKMQIIGLRFFTVYGPFGRPDMAPFIFSDAICNNRTIKIFNNGDMSRDFTYIDDIVEGIYRLIIVDNDYGYKVFNIGNSSPTNLLEFLSALENNFGKKAVIEFHEMQPGDVKSTFADTTQISDATGFIPKINIVDGVEKFTNWYKSFYKIKIV